MISLFKLTFLKEFEEEEEIKDNLHSYTSKVNVEAEENKYVLNLCQYRGLTNCGIHFSFTEQEKTSVNPFSVNKDLDNIVTA